MKRKIVNIFCCLLVAMIPNMALADVTEDLSKNIHLIDRNQYVEDKAGILSAEDKQRINALINKIWETTTAEVIVEIVSELPGNLPGIYANQRFDALGLGKKDTGNGLLLFISMADNEAVIRTGNGLEGVLPDVIYSRILRRVFLPLMQKGEIGEAIYQTLEAVDGIISDPENSSEIVSKYANDTAQNHRSISDDIKGILTFFYLGGIIAVVMLIVLLVKYNEDSEKDRHYRYNSLNSLSRWFLMLTFVGMGAPLPVYLLLNWLKNRVRLKVPECENCGCRMRLIDEIHDNDYLTPSQDLEEKLNTVDYDVWLCDNCSNTEIWPYVKKETNYSECPNCGAIAERVESMRVLKQPTTSAPGIEEVTCFCENCKNRRKKHMKIEPQPSSGSNVGAAILGAAIGAALSGGRGGNGGPSGGSFGGGSTAGGGASIRW